MKTIQIKNENYYVAPTYQTDAYTIADTPFLNEKNKLCINLRSKCDRCCGSGIFYIFGTCYKCGGAGITLTKVRLYTEKEYNTLIQAKQAREEKIQAEKKAKQEDAINNAAFYKAEIAKKFGFNEAGNTYLVYGGNTYDIKEKLKEFGAKFDPIMKWHLPEKIELPEEYHFCEIAFDEIFDYKPLVKWAEYKENAAEIVNRKIAELKGPSTSEFYPAPEGTRIRNITTKVSKVSSFAGIYGYTHVYTFTSENYVFVWMTTAQQQCSVGDLVDLTGTIKKFDEYMGDKITHLSRCRIVKIQ